MNDCSPSMPQGIARIFRQALSASDTGSRCLADSDGLHIALVTETYPPEINGVANTLSHLVQGMLAKGHAIHLIRPRQGAKDEVMITNPRLCQTLKPGLPIPGYKDLHFGLPARKSIMQTWQHNRPDVVYIATQGPLGMSALSAARKLGIPVISGFHTNFHSYSRYYGLGLLESLISAMLRNFHNKTDCTLVPTQALRSELEAFGFRQCKVLARGVDTQRFHPGKRDTLLRRRWGVGENDQVVLYVGRLAPEKNLQLLLETFRVLQTYHANVRLVLVGDGPMRCELARLHPDFIFAGMQTGEQLARHYASGDVFLFPSLSETFGNVVLEAMASGLPIVAFDYAAAAEHLVHRQLAMLAPVGDHATFIKLSLELLNDPDSLKRFGESVREVAQSIDWKHIYNNLEYIFQFHANRDRNHATATENE